MKTSVANRALAQRYASALADSLPKVEEVGKAIEELEALVAVIDGSPDLFKVLTNPGFAGERSDIISKILELLKPSELVKRFVDLLVERDRILILPDIISALKAIVYERTGRVEVDVTSAADLNDDQLRQLVARLAAITKKAEDSFDINVHVDPKLWGGLKAKIGSVVYDASLRSQLEQVAANLRKEI